MAAKTVADVMKMVKENEVKFVDFRFTDTRGKEQHVTVPLSHFDEDKFVSGHAFDGSSIAGWKGIEASDMLLMPDPASAHVDPFFAQTTLAVFCDVIEPSTGVGDKIFVGPEAEFFIFDDVRFSSDVYNCGFKVDSSELPSNSNTEYEMGNLAHRPR